MQPSINYEDEIKRYNYYDSIFDQVIGTDRLILYGPPKIGKTTLARLCLSYRYLLVRNIKTDLNKFDRNIHGGILFENVDFRYIGPLYILMLLYFPERLMEHGYCEVEILADIRMVFTTPIDGGRIFHNSLKKAYDICTMVDLNTEPHYDDSMEEDEEMTIIELIVYPDMR